MAKEITLKCKNCEKLFQYNEGAYRLMAEKGESKFLRCEECREVHGRETVEAKVPYHQFRKETVSLLKFNLSQLVYTFHGEQVLQEEEKEKIDYSENLIITNKEILTLYQMLEENQVVIVAAPTGAGKSTFMPTRLIEPPEGYSGDFIERLIRQGQIIITQPRILPTLATIHTTAEMLGTSVGLGALCGFRYSGEDRSGRWNKAITITDGTLPNWIREGKLGQYSLIMVDEAHERSCNIDWILGTLRMELSKYPQLKLIIASATINTQRFLDAFRKMNISAELLDLSFLEEKRKHKSYIHFWKDENVYRLSKEGRLEKVEDCHCWLCQKSAKERREFWESRKDEISEYELPEITATLVSKILRETKKGDILVFLHGERAINQTVRKIEARHREVKVIPAYRKIQKDVERELAKETTKRRVIVGTNLLETSLTLEGAVYGIDSGFIKEAKWDPDTQIDTLPTEPHSQDGRKQRWGRLARTEDGYVYNLYTKEEFEKAKEHTLPEITRRPLEDFLADLKANRITEFEEFPWMEKSSDHPQMEKEIKRANLVLKERGVIDQKEKITERALELLGIPRQAGEAAFLISADEQGFLFEAMTVLFLMSTREQGVRTGANLYSPGLGLLLWEPEWDAKTKMKVWAIHQGLRTGCRDDLDFVIKLAYCLHKVESKGIAQEWAKWHFINYPSKAKGGEERMFFGYGNFQKILSEIDELITEKFREEREESLREIDITQLDKIRALMVTAWPEKVVNLKPGEPITYPVAGKIKVGVVSRHCAGNWQEKKQAIAAAAIEEEAVVNGYPQRVPTASFMVQLPGQLPAESPVNLFMDQRFPVGSWVQIGETDGRFYLGELEKLPSPIKVSYRKTLDTSEDYSEEAVKKEEEIPFYKDFLIEEGPPVPFEGIWISEQKAEKARIVEWVERDRIPIALISSFEGSAISSLGKKKGDTLEVKIYQVTREPGRRGWILARTREGFDIPIELSEMSLSPLGPGLERIKGQILSLAIKDFDEDGLPQLNNIDKILEDLRKLRDEIAKSEKATEVSQRNFIELPGFIDEINEEEEKAVAVAPGENGIFHPFEVAQTYVPGGDLKNLRISQEVIVRLFRRTDNDEIPIEYLTDEEIRNRPKHWKLQEEKNKLLVPFCLKDKDLQDWSARSEVIDFVKRHSWQYCFNAQIRVTFLAEAEISWSPTQYLMRSKDYDIGRITGRFIGKKGENIKNLIGGEQARIEIRGFRVTIRAQSEDVRRTVCQRISRWFKEELNIVLKWVYSQK